MRSAIDVTNHYLRAQEIANRQKLIFNCCRKDIRDISLNTADYERSRNRHRIVTDVEEGIIEKMFEERIGEDATAKYHNPS